MRKAHAPQLQGLSQPARPRDKNRYTRSLLVILLTTFLTSAETYGGWQELAWDNLLDILPWSVYPLFRLVDFLPYLITLPVIPTS